MSITDLTVPRQLAAPSALALVVVTLSGCGSSSSSSSSAKTSTSAPASSSTPTTSATAPTSATSTTAASAAADERIARDAELKLTDFPSGWEQRDSTQESNSESKCEGLDAAKAAASIRQKSPDFVRGSGNNQAQSNVYIYAEVPAATTAFGQLSSQTTRTCLGERVGKLLANQKEKGVTVGKITSGQVSMARLGDERSVGRLTIPFSAKGLNFSLYVDLVFVRVGRALAIFTLQDTLSPFDTALRDDLTKAVVDRLQTGLKQSP